MGSKSSSKTAKGSKQNASKANGGKLQSQETQIERDPNGEPHIDVSSLRKPVDISVSGVGQVVKVYQTGTTEVRQMLAYECDLVYECKICRNLFRSLANFLSHKRAYCKEQYGDTKCVIPANHLVEDCTTVILPEPVLPDPTETWVTNDAAPDLTTDDTEIPSSPRIETSVPRIATYSHNKRKINHVVERLSKKKRIKGVAESVGCVSSSKFYDAVSEQVAAQRDARQEHIIHLEATENTKFGVFQTVLESNSAVQMDNIDLMKAQVVELHNMMSCNEATLGPDGQIEMLNCEGTTLLPNAANTNENGAVAVRKQDSAQNNKIGSSKNHVCTICNTRFATRKTLNHHMKYLHVTFRLCYPCPCCKNTFCNTWSVYRHLYKVHRKTAIQVRKLRSQIVNKAFRKEVSDYESQNSSVKSTGAAVQSEADRAREEQQRLHQENQDWMNNFEDDLELQMCGGCGRRFERRAALSSHSQICQKRIAVQNNIKARRPCPPTSATTSSRITNTKILPTSTEQQPRLHTETTKNDVTCVESNTTVRSINHDGSSIQSVQDACLDKNGNQSQESSDVTKIKNTGILMRINEKQNIGMDTASDEGIRWDSVSSTALSEDSEIKTVGNEQENVLVPAANTKKDEQLSSAMENRMRSIINIRRLQCLPCQKKFNKLTNLRRHVAVHIGWNRYRCTECAFKCFSKYDCVAHVIKIHLEKGEHDKAQSMVEYIETETNDIENDLSNCEPTEETYRSHSEENGQNMLCDINLSNKCIPVPEDVEITVNDTTCNEISDWSLQECDEGKTITSTSDYDMGIEAVPNDIQNLVMKLKDAEDNDLYACGMEGERANDVVVDMPIKQGPLITTGSTANSAETIEMKSGNVDETLVKDTAIILQAEEAREPIISTSPVRLGLKRCCMSTEDLEHEEPEAVPSKKMLTTTEYQQSTRNVAVLDFEENAALKPKMIDMESEPDMHSDPVQTSVEGSTLQVDSLSETQAQEQTALRKMVLEVIFGSGNSNMNRDVEAAQNIFAMAMNGDHDQSGGSASSPEPYDIVESVSCDSTSPLTTNSSAASPVLTSDDGASVVMEQTLSAKGEGGNGQQNKLSNSISPILETERRQRPVRNRIKVEKEDFIYDLSDRCLDPRRDGEDRKGMKRKQEDRMRDVKLVLDKGNYSGESSPTKVLPKLMFVRTNMGEYSGVRVVNKSGINSNMTQVLDNNSGKNISSNTVGYNISTRKSQRTFDISPHKVSTISKERSE
ncbi:uncharacterized protein LOC111874378 isoform X2 [Cryptotermes secundus]|uniref:uncharacterized protein LOC111874378 isoform X2 n=1 Tax=Cryptotermes secundus TaxID=105785 RepID=UPI000CD7D971|nr:uncharacterized protein LOC111874378 isoform X2 [Cryptotermes secundus]